MSMTIGTKPGTGWELNFWGRKWPIPFFHPWPEVLDDKLVRSHKMVVATTGRGKSKHLTTQLLSYHEQGMAYIVFDPDTSTANELMGHLYDRGFFNDPSSLEKLIYLELGNPEWHFPLDLTKLPKAHEVLVEGAKRAYPALDGPGGSQHFDRCFSAMVQLLQSIGMPLPLMHEILCDDKKLRALKDRGPEHVRHFIEYYLGLPETSKAVITSSTTNRAWDFIDKEAFRKTLGQQTLGIDFADILKSGKSVIINTGLLKDMVGRQFNCWLLALIEQTALDFEPYTTPTTQLVIDEAASFISRSPASVEHLLTKGRRHGLFVTFALQNLDQAAQSLQAASQNCNVRTCLGTKEKDANELAAAFLDFDKNTLKGQGPNGNPIYSTYQDQLMEWSQKLQVLPERHAYLKIDNQPPVTFRTADVPDPKCTKAQLEMIKLAYFQKYYTHESQLKLVFQGKPLPKAPPTQPNPFGP